MEAHHLVNQPFNVKLPGEFGSAKVAALHHPAALLEPPTRLLFPFIAFALLCSHCCFVLYHLRFVGATWLPAFEPDPAHTGLPAQRQGRRRCPRPRVRRRAGPAQPARHSWRGTNGVPAPKSPPATLGATLCATVSRTMTPRVELRRCVRRIVRRTGRTAITVRALIPVWGGFRAGFARIPCGFRARTPNSSGALRSVARAQAALTSLTVSRTGSRTHGQRATLK